MPQVLVETAESDPGIGTVGPVNHWYEKPTVIRSPGGTIRWWTGDMHNIGCNQVDRGQFGDAKEVDWVAGCALLIKRTTLDSIGLLYAGYFTFFEEVDWCVRARRSKHRVVCTPRAQMWHKSKTGEPKTSPVPPYYWTRNRFPFMKRNASSLQFLMSSLYFIPRYLVLRTLSLLLQERNLNLLGAMYRGTRAPELVKGPARGLYRRYLRRRNASHKTAVL
jgi:GT2 family glycosyltransferase